MQTNQLPQTTQFLSTCPEQVYGCVPQLFVDQANTGWNKHQITGDFFLNRLVSIELNNPSLRQDLTTGETYITCKMKLRAILDSNFNFVPQQQGKTVLDPGTSWLKGHYSPEIRFDRALVEAGYITSDELEALIKYEELWRSMGTEQYSKNAAPGAKSNSKKRLYLTAKTVDAKFQFFYTVRSNPQTGEQVPGLTELAWTGMHLIGSTTGGVVERLADAVQIMSAQGGDFLNRPRGQGVVVQDVTTIAGAAGRPRPQFGG